MQQAIKSSFLCLVDAILKDGFVILYLKPVFVGMALFASGNSVDPDTFTPQMFIIGVMDMQVVIHSTLGTLMTEVVQSRLTLGSPVITE
jgi:hypothetical protein